MRIQIQSSRSLQFTFASARTKGAPVTVKGTNKHQNRQVPNRRQSVMSEYTTSRSIDRAPLSSGSASEQRADTSSLHGKMMHPGRSQRAQAGDPVLCHSDTLIQAGQGRSLSHCPTGRVTQTHQAASGKRQHRLKLQYAIRWGLGKSDGDWATRISPGLIL